MRLIAPLLADKHTDPGIVCVDEARTFAVSVAGGHGGGANELTERVADLLGATPVITTASDATGTTPLDELVGLIDATVDGDLAACGVALLDGAPIRLVNPLGFPLPALPPNIGQDVESPEWIVLIDDLALTEEPQSPTLRLIPPTLVVGHRVGEGRAGRHGEGGAGAAGSRARLRSARGARLRHRRHQDRRAGNTRRDRGLVVLALAGRT